MKRPTHARDPTPDENGDPTDTKKRKQDEGGEEEEGEEAGLRFAHLEVLDVNLLFEVLKHADARMLATAACVSKQWQRTAQDERLWEMIYTSHWRCIFVLFDVRTTRDEPVRTVRSLEMKHPTHAIDPTPDENCDPTNTKKRKQDEGGEEEEGEEAGARFAHLEVLDENLLFEVLKHADAQTLATTACVGKQWQWTAQDERLWEMICTRH